MKICFTLGNGKDIKTIGSAMNLKTDESRFVDKLKVGHAIVKIKERFDVPIHVRFPKVPIDKSVGSSVGTP